MPLDGRPLERLGFLTIGSFDPARPGLGHEETLRVIERAEDLGFDSAWLRHRHMQHGVSSPVALMAAASQRTSRITLGTAVTPIGTENPFRLAEDLATVDVLLGGRLNPGFSSGTPMHYDLYQEALYPDTAEQEDLSEARLLRFRDLVRGAPVVDSVERRGIEEFATTVQPQSPGLADRLWYGTGSTRSAVWAAQNGFHLLTSSVTRSEIGTDFATNQRAQVDAYLEAHPSPATARVSQGLVVIPTDTATPEQEARYRSYVEGRSGRVGVPMGPGKLLFAADLVGTSREIADRLRADAGYQVATEVAFALPFSFEAEDYAQIVTDIAERLGPALGWAPWGGWRALTPSFGAKACSAQRTQKPQAEPTWIQRTRSDVPLRDLRCIDIPPPYYGLSEPDGDLHHPRTRRISTAPSLTTRRSPADHQASPRPEMAQDRSQR